MALKMMLATAAAGAARSVPYAALKTAGPKSFVAQASDRMVLKSTPINPDWIISGNPQARTAEISRGNDDAALTAIWDCTAGEFRWRFCWDETVMILEGEVHIIAEDGTERTLQVRRCRLLCRRHLGELARGQLCAQGCVPGKPFPKPVALAYRPAQPACAATCRRAASRPEDFAVARRGAADWRCFRGLTDLHLSGIRLRDGNGQDQERRGPDGPCRPPSTSPAIPPSP